MKDVGSLMQRAMDGAWCRHETLAGNVANSETPGYKRQDVDFRGTLQNALKARLPMAGKDPGHFEGNAGTGFQVSQDLRAISPDGNGVDIDLEMGELSTNALYYAAVSRQMAAYLSVIRKAITEGRR